MSISHRLYVGMPATRHELRDVPVGAGIGFKASPDMMGRARGLPDISLGASAATSITIVDDLSRRTERLDNGVVARRYVSFGDRRLYMDDPDNPESFADQTIQGVMALLRAFLEANAYMLGWDAARPLLLRRGGRLVLAQAKAGPDGFWGADGSPKRALVEVPYTVEPLGPWDYVPVDA